MEEPGDVVETGPAFVMRDRDIETKDGSARISILVCEPLEEAGFINAFSTRLGGVSPLPSDALNLADLTGYRKENVSENRRRFLEAMGAAQSELVTARQTHSVDRFTIERPEQARLPQPDCAAMITRITGVLLAVQTADCMPVLIGDTRTGTVAAIHAGWRGTAGRIVERTVADFFLFPGGNTRDCFAALGASACAKCYEVGEDVISRYKSEFGYWRKLLVNFKENGKAHLD